MISPFSRSISSQMKPQARWGSLSGSARSARSLRAGCIPWRGRLAVLQRCNARACAILGRVPAPRPLLVACLLALATCISYAGVIGNAFVNYDDDLYVVDRPEVREGITPDGVVWAFTSFQGANWFPLTRLSWMLDAQLFGVDAAAFHGVGLAFHLANALLLFAALRRLTGDTGPSAFAAGVFALHPLHVESVAWVAARKDVVSGLFFMLALLAHERVARGSRPLLWGSLLFAAAALGLMAKPMLVTLPCVLLLLDAWPLARWSPTDPRRRWRAVAEKLPLFALAAAVGVVTLLAQRAGGALQGADRYPLEVRLENAVVAYATYGLRAFWPSGLSAFYPHPHASLPAWRIAGAALLLVGVSVWVVREWRRRPYLAVGWLWFAGMLIPVSGLVQVGQAALADRYTYLPLIGLSIAVAWGLRELGARRERLARWLPVAALSVLLALACATAAQVRVWRDSRSLFEHALAVTRRNHVARINLGQALAAEGQLAEAERQLDAALELEPGSATAWGLRGELRLASERFDAAAADFGAALRLEPEAPRWRVGRGRVRAARGDAAGAIEDFAAALERDPDQAEVRARLAALLAARGEPQAALEQLDQALRLEPERPEFHAERAALLERGGETEAAIAAYRRALELGGRTPRVLNNLAWLLCSAPAPGSSDPDGAVALAEEATRLTARGDPGVLDTLATAYAAAGRAAEADVTAQEALRLAERLQQAALARSIRSRFPSAGGPPSR